MASLSETSNPILLLAAFFIGAFLLRQWLASFNYRKRLPPGPPGAPIVGNLFQLPQDAWTLFTEWRQVYGKSSQLLRPRRKHISENMARPHRITQLGGNECHRLEYEQSRD